jgi:hypothetical protein
VLYLSLFFVVIPFLLSSDVSRLVFLRALHLRWLEGSRHCLAHLVGAAAWFGLPAGSERAAQRGARRNAVQSRRLGVSTASATGGVLDAVHSGRVWMLVFCVCVCFLCGLLYLPCR